MTQHLLVIIEIKLNSWDSTFFVALPSARLGFSIPDAFLLAANTVMQSCSLTKGQILYAPVFCISCGFPASQCFTGLFLFVTLYHPSTGTAIAGTGKTNFQIICYFYMQFKETRPDKTSHQHPLPPCMTGLFLRPGWACRCLRGWVMPRQSFYGYSD